MSLAGKCVLVTGGAGFVGSHLVDRLIAEQPARVVVVDNLFLGKPANLLSARELLGDTLRSYWESADDIDVMRRILDEEGVQVVFDLSVIPLPTSLERPLWVVDQNVRLAGVICELLREGRYETLIHFSSSEAYGTAQYVPIDELHPLMPSTPYAASKIAGDHVALSYWHTFGLDIAVLRPFNNYGPRQNAGTYAGIIPLVVTRVQAGLPIEIYGDGEQTRDFIFVRDTAEAAIRMYDRPASRGRVINVGSGREYSVNELVADILHAMGADDHPIVHVAPRPGDVRRHLGGIALAEELLDFSPGTKLVDGLTETVQWYLATCPKTAPCA